MALSEEIRSKIDGLVGSDEVVLFMKGVRNAPQCGFSATVVQLLDQYVPDYTTVDVLADPAMREGIKEYSSWPTIPQLYVRGEFVGGCDIVRELDESGELAGQLGELVAKPEPPSITITDAAAEVFRQALEDVDKGTIRVSIGPGFDYDLVVDELSDKLIEVESNGVKLLFDAGSARRAEGLTIDYVTSPQPGFKMDNPNAPPQVEHITAADLKARLDAGDALRLIDVRSPDEAETARIDGAELLDEALLGQLLELPKDTVLVFHCHHGQRSHQVAMHFISQGFRTVHNLVGGIHAWSQDVDPDVPQY